MRIPLATWLSCAGVVFLAGLLQNSADLLIVSGVTAGVGLGVRLLPPLRDRLRLKREGMADNARMLQVEERLRLAEQALTSATDELARLKERD